MKVFTKKHLFLTLIFTLSVICACSCTKKGTDTQSDAVATVSVYIEDEDKYIIDNEKVAIEKENETAFDILKKITQEKKIQMEFSGNGESAYVEGIDNLYSLDKGDKSGWLFYVNGSMSEVGAGQAVAKDGDNIEWKYVLDYTTAS